MVQIQKTQHQMVITAKESSIVYQGEMMKAIPWLLPFAWKSETELIYEKGTGLNLPAWLQTEKREDEIVNMVEAYLKIQRELESYLMDEEKLSYDPEWIFWEPIEKRLQFAYVPWDFPTGVHPSFLKRLTGMLCSASVNQRWQNERLILMLHRMQIAVKQNQDQLQLWTQWMERERKKMQERDAIKEQALDILTEEEPKKTEKGWLLWLKEKIPIVIR